MSAESMRLRSTARDLLVEVAGVAHADHTVVVKQKMSKRGGALNFRCSCGVKCVVAATEENKALRNVPEEAS